MLTLEPMTQAEFESYLAPAIADYAEGHVADGQWAPAEALEKARKEFQDLLPQGIQTPDQYLFTLVNDAQQKVGMLWFALRGGPGHGSAWVYDVRIDDAFQRHGLGTELLSRLVATEQSPVAAIWARSVAPGRSMVKAWPSAVTRPALSSLNT